MAKVLVTESYLEDIGDAIRAKLETQDTYTPSEMAGAIGQISGGATLISKTITQNGTYNAADESADGYSSVVVDVAGGGSGSTTYVGTTNPLQSQGHIGDFYVKYVRPGEPGGEISRNYVLDITKGLRGSSELTYVGAHEIQLFYDDGNGNEVNIRTLPNFAYTASGNSSSASAIFDGNTGGSYWESYPTPITVTFSATVPSEYTLKRFVVWQRQSSYTSDVWADFTLTETIGGETNTILSEVGLTVNDWAGAGNGTEWDLSDAPVPSMVIGATYVKVGASEQSAEWIEAPIVVFLGNSESVENLYANGTFYESFAPFSAQSNNQTFTVNTNSLEFTRVAHGSTGFIYYTANKIDLTDVKEIVMNASVSFGYEHKDGNYYPHLGVFSAVSSWSSYTMVSETPIHEGVDLTVLDVSNLSGEYYVGIYGYALTATVSQIFLYKEANIA